MKKLLLILILPFILTGCITPVELKERAIVQSVGVDVKDDEYKVTMQIFSPSGSPKDAGFSSGKMNNKIIEGTGKSLTEAFVMASISCGKRVFIGNNKIVIVGEETAKKSVEEILNFFNSNHQCRPKTKIAVCEGKAEDMLKAKEGEENVISADTVDTILKSTYEAGMSGESTILWAVQAMVNDGSDFYLSYLKQEKGPDDKSIVKVDGAALFKELKMIDKINEDQIKGVAWVWGDLESVTLTITDEELGVFSVIINSAKNKIRPFIQDGKLGFNIDIKAEGGVYEVIKPHVSSVDIKDLDKIGKLVDDKIFDDVEKAMQMLLYKNGSDIFLLNKYVEKYEPVFWKENKDNWYEILKESPVFVQVNSDIQRKGIEIKKRY